MVYIESMYHVKRVSSLRAIAPSSVVDQYWKNLLFFSALLVFSLKFEEYFLHWMCGTDSGLLFLSIKDELLFNKHREGTTANIDSIKPLNRIGSMRISSLTRPIGL